MSRLAEALVLVALILFATVLTACSPLGLQHTGLSRQVCYQTISGPARCVTR